MAHIPNDTTIDSYFTLTKSCCCIKKPTTIPLIHFWHYCSQEDRFSRNTWLLMMVSLGSLVGFLLV